MNKTKKIIIAVFLVLIVAILLLVGFAGNYFYDLAVNANTSKSFLNDSAHLGSTDTSGNLSEYAVIRQEALDWGETVYEKQTIQSFDDLALNAYYFPNPDAGHRYAVVVHGYTGKALDMILSIQTIYETGYSILAPDCRGGGDSEGSYVGMGWDDRLDVVDWIDVIIENDPEAEIMLYGVSMGGATVMMVSGEDLPSNVKVIVEDCGYTSAHDIFTYQLRDLFNLPPFPIMQSASLVTKIRAGYFLEDASALKQVAKSVTPMLFIHGDADAFVPFSMLDTLYEAASCPKQKYVVSGAPHGAASSVDGPLYWETVFGFVDQYMN